MLYGKNDGGLYVPSYYKKFKCTADKCKHSCCTDWNIRIDNEALARYETIDSIARTVTEDCDGAYFKLCDDGRCPHLNERGLCNIIINHGEELLSDICRQHPRFFNDVSGSVREVGLGIACEEACRIILEDDKPFSMYRLGELSNPSTFAGNFDPLPQREKIISVTEAVGMSLDEKLRLLRKQFELPDIYTKNEWLDILLSLEILDTRWELLLKEAKQAIPQKAHGDLEGPLSRLLTYFVFRHVSVAESEDNLRARLAFCILSLEMTALIFEARGGSALELLLDTARLYSSEIEYSEENTAELIFEFESVI